MKRRSFLQGSLAGAALATSAAAAAQHAGTYQHPSPAPLASTPPATAPPASEDPAIAHAIPNGPSASSDPVARPREFYLLRRYRLQRTQVAGCDQYLSQALLPALGRLGFGESGAFGLDFGEETPAIYLLLRHTDLPKLLHLDEALAGDPAYLRQAAPFRAASAAKPSFERIDSTLLHAFRGWPALQLPPRARRILQLRTYESHSEASHLLKVEMFHSGEFDIFAQCGMHQVFYGQTLVGQRTPSLTYLLSHDSLADMESKWDRFRTNADWKKLSSLPRFSDEDPVSNITNLVLTPKPYSQI